MDMKIDATPLVEPEHRPARGVQAVKKVAAARIAEALAAKNYKLLAARLDDYCAPVDDGIEELDAAFNILNTLRMVLAEKPLIEFVQLRWEHINSDDGGYVEVSCRGAQASQETNRLVSYPHYLNGQVFDSVWFTLLDVPTPLRISREDIFGSEYDVIRALTRNSSLRYSAPFNTLLGLV